LKNDEIDFTIIISSIFAQFKQIILSKLCGLVALRPAALRNFRPTALILLSRHPYLIKKMPLLCPFFVLHCWLFIIYFIIIKIIKVRINLIKNDVF